MKKELREHIIEENKYSELLKSNPQYRLQGAFLRRGKWERVVGIIQGNPEDYKPYHHLNFKSFNSWKEAYEQLVLNH